MPEKYYTKETVLLEFQKGRDAVRVMIGSKEVKGEVREYLDIRTWYTDEGGELMPGKGFAKPLTRAEMQNIGQVILDYVGALAD